MAKLPPKTSTKRSTGRNKGAASSAPSSKKGASRKGASGSSKGSGKGRRRSPAPKQSSSMPMVLGALGVLVAAVLVVVFVFSEEKPKPQKVEAPPPVVEKKKPTKAGPRIPLARRKTIYKAVATEVRQKDEAFKAEAAEKYPVPAGMDQFKARSIRKQQHAHSNSKLVALKRKLASDHSASSKELEDILLEGLMNDWAK